MKPILILLLLLIPGSCLLAQTNKDYIENSYEGYIMKSYDFLDKNDLVSAEESLRTAMRLEPGNPTNYALLSNLGTIQRRQGKLQEALLSYSAALSRQPKDIGILSNRASLYSELGETEKALSDYTALLLIDPAHQEALYCRGLIYIQLKNFLWAEQDFDKIMEVNEKTVRGRLGHAILEKMRGNYTESERIFNYLIDKMPHDWILYEGRADLYFMMGKNARAMADINRVFIESKPNAGLYVLRGKIKLSQYEREGAALDFQKAAEMGYDKQVIAELLKMTQSTEHAPTSRKEEDNNN